MILTAEKIDGIQANMRESTTFLMDNPFTFHTFGEANSARNFSKRID